MSKFELNYKKAGFVLVMTCFILPIAVYCIYIALNYSQMYAIHTKVRRALLEAAVAVSKEVRASGDIMEGTTENTRLLIIAQNAFIHGLGVNLGGGGSIEVEVPQFLVTLGRNGKNNYYTNLYSEYPVNPSNSDTTPLNTSQLKTNVTSIFANTFYTKNIYDFEIVKFSCDMGTDDSGSGVTSEEIPDSKRWNLGAGPGYCLKKDGDTSSFNCLDTKVYKNTIPWNCQLIVNVHASKNDVDAVIKKNNIGNSLDRMFFAEKRQSTGMMNIQGYPEDKDINLGHGAKTKLSNFGLVVSGNIITTRCTYTFIKTDVSGSVKETITSARRISVSGASKKHVDVAIAVPLHNLDPKPLPDGTGDPDNPENAKKIEGLRDKIVKFIKRINVANIRVAIVPYSASVVAPENANNLSLTTWPDVPGTFKALSYGGDESSISYPEIRVIDLYHSLGRNEASKVLDFKSTNELYENPHTDELIQKLMYPVKSGTRNEYDPDGDISSEIIGRKFLVLNNNPCIGTHGNPTTVGGWFGTGNYSPPALYCDTFPKMLETHSYSIKLLTTNIMDAAMYVSLLTDSYEKSTFQYVGLIWAARVINSRNNSTLYYGVDTDSRPGENSSTEKFIVLIASKEDNFSQNEMTHLGLLNDSGDDALNCDQNGNCTNAEGFNGNKALGVAAIECTTMIKEKMYLAYQKIKEEMNNCRIYLISYGARRITDSVPFENCGDNVDSLEAYLMKVADDILATVGGEITILE